MAKANTGNAWITNALLAVLVLGCGGWGGYVITRLNGFQTHVNACTGLHGAHGAAIDHIKETLCRIEDRLWELKP